MSLTISQSFPKFMSIEPVIISNHLIFCHPLLFFPSIFPSIRGYSKELILCFRWPKYQSFSFSISPSNEYSGLIPFRIKWFDLNWTVCYPRDSEESSPAPQFVSSPWAFSLLYGPTLTSVHNYWKDHINYTDLCWQSDIFVFEYDALGFIIASLLRIKCILILWLQLPSTVILEPKKKKSASASTFSPFICHKVMELDAVIFVCWMLTFKPKFSSSSRGSFVPLHFLSLEW